VFYNPSVAFGDTSPKGEVCAINWNLYRNKSTSGAYTDRR